MTKKYDHNQIILPALRGVMGDWVYYSCLMNLKELSERVNYADVIHKNKNLSDMIQRTLMGQRSKQIASYLKQPERFFNSLVIATYGGQPNWQAVRKVNPVGKDSELLSLSEDTLNSVGFLTLRGDERLFAIDGQHRLAGIKKAIASNDIDNDPYDFVSVIFVGHKEDKRGLERTRRLFTTLNKAAKPVSKRDIIALDEDDVCALCVRHLIEKTELFSEQRIAFVASNNMPNNNFDSLTTIGNLYDTIQLLLTQANTEFKSSKQSLLLRPQDSDLEKYFNFCEVFFQFLGKYMPELKEFFSAKNYTQVVQKYRGPHGGNVLFRPIGLEIFTRIIINLTREMSLEMAIKTAAKLPRDIAKEPYKNLLWDESNQTISNAHKVTLRELLLYMIGYSKLPAQTLVEKYRKETGNEELNLPTKLSK